MTSAPRRSSARRLLLAACVVGWLCAAVVVLRWHVAPSFGDGDCGSVWSVLRGGGMRGCAGPARTAALVGLGLVTFLILGLALVGRTLRRVLD